MVLMVALVPQKKSIESIIINLSKAKAKFCLHYSADKSYLYVNKTEICKLKAIDNISWYSFCLGSISKDFAKDE